MSNRFIHIGLKIMLPIVIFGGIYLIWFYQIDGVLMNRPIEYVNGVDIANLKLEKQVYTAGEEVFGYTAFCKTRKSYGKVQWSIVNSEILFLPSSQLSSIPEGCYPQGAGVKLFKIGTIPKGAKPGEHYFVGTTTNYLSAGREITTYLKTETFIVK